MMFVCTSSVCVHLFSKWLYIYIWKWIVANPEFYLRAPPVRWEVSSTSAWASSPHPSPRLAPPLSAHSYLVTCPMADSQHGRKSHANSLMSQTEGLLHCQICFLLSANVCFNKTVGTKWLLLNQNHDFLNISYVILLQIATYRSPRSEFFFLISQK